jgi:hypothetical protein
VRFFAFVLLFLEFLFRGPRRVGVCCTASIYGVPPLQLSPTLFSHPKADTKTEEERLLVGLPPNRNRSRNEEIVRDVVGLGLCFSCFVHTVGRLLPHWDSARQLPYQFIGCNVCRFFHSIRPAAMPRFLFPSLCHLRFPIQVFRALLSCLLADNRNWRNI